MGVQVVQDDSDPIGLGIGLVTQPPHLVGEVLHASLLGDGDMSPASKGLTIQK